MHSFPLGTKWKLKFHPQPRSKMDVEGGLATSYGDLKRYLLTPIPKNNTPLPTHAVVHLWLLLAKDALLLALK